MNAALPPSAAQRPVTLIVLAWNGWDITRRALDSLLACELDGATVLVVDNGSTDETARGLRAYADRVRVLRLPENLGYVRGNNAGIAAADPSHDIVLLNNDLEFPQRDWLVRLRECAHAPLRTHAGEKPLSVSPLTSHVENRDVFVPRAQDARKAASRSTGIVGCRLADGNGHLLHAGSVILPDDCRGVQLASGRVERDIGQYAGRDREVQGIAFAVAYIKREVIAAIGALHADYDTYFEDSDYCLRARAAGFATVLCGGVDVVHRQHGSTGSDAARRERLYAQGQATFRRHWQSALRAEYRQRVLWQSALEFPPRFAAWSRPLLRALDRAGVELCYDSLYRDLPPPLRESGDSHDHVLNAIRARSLSPSAPITIACGEGELFRHAQGRHRIGYGDFATREELDADTVAAWNAVDEAWVPSDWHAQALRDVGVSREIVVMPRGVDADYFHPQLVRRANPCGEFVFLLAAAWDEREQPWCVLRAFSQAFRRNERVRLLAWIDGSGVDLAAAIRALDLDPHGGRMSFLLDRDIPDYQRGVMYRAADAFAMAPCGAAGEQRLLEAMAVGLPVIAPMHAAFGDLVSEAHGWPLPCAEADSAHGSTGPVLSLSKDSPRTEPSDDASDIALIAALRAAAASRAQASTRGAQASAHVLRERTSEHAATRIVARLDELAARAASTPSTVSSLGERAAAMGRSVPQSSRTHVIVLGMHRSGTSCVAGTLQIMGLYGGEAHEFLANEAENPFGFFERGDLHAACVTALAQRGGDWSIPLGWGDADAAFARANFRAALKPIFASLEARGSWFVKEPRLCLLADEVIDLLDVPILVHVWRDPRAVARSLARRDGLTMPHALALWECYQLTALRTMRGRRSVRIDYDALQRDPAPVLVRLHADLRAQGAAGLRALQPAECAAWVRPEFDRAAFGDDVPLPPEIDALWRALREGEAFDDVPTLSADSERLLRQLHTEHQLVLQRQRDRG